jgi:hypothetical protein
MTKKRPQPLPPATPEELPKDVALLRGPTEDGKGARVVRFKEGAVFAGEVRPLRDGQPIDQHEVVRLRPLAGRGPLCEVEVLHAPAPRRENAGPARVASDSYRRNWNAVFGPPGRKKSPKADWSVN